MKVLVTGATGFIAGYCITELLSHGYEVRGTVRDLARADVAHLRAIADEVSGSLELVEASLDSDDGWDAAVAGCSAVLHVASPNPKLAPANDDDVIRPAVDGTLRVLRAAAASGSVRRVVLTSSSDSVTAGHPRGDQSVRTEADWADLDNAGSYAKSKTLAERAAWEFVEGTGLELVTIIPGLVLGPAQRAGSNASLESVRLLLAHELPLVPQLGFAIVDVRDVAQAHRRAMEIPEAAGQRYIVAGRNHWLGEIAGILHETYAPRGYRIATLRMPRWLMWVVARFDSGVRLALPYVGRPVLVTSDKARGELGWTDRPARESIIDAAESLLAHGTVPRSASDVSTRR